MAITEHGQHVFRVPSRDRVAKILGDGEDRQRVAQVIGDEASGQGVGCVAGQQERVVVEEGVFDSCLAEKRREARLPHPLGEPHATRCFAEVTAAGNQRARKSGPEHLREVSREGSDRRRRHQPTRSGRASCESFENIRSVSFQPLQERPGVMQVDPETGVIRQNLQEGEIRVITSSVGDVAQVADRLMAMGRKDEVQDCAPRGTGQRYRRGSQLAGRSWMLNSRS